MDIALVSIRMDKDAEMDFVTASDRLAYCPTHFDMAAELAGGAEDRIPALVQQIRQARLDPSHANPVIRLATGRGPSPASPESGLRTS